MVPWLKKGINPLLGLSKQIENNFKKG